MVRGYDRGRPGRDDRPRDDMTEKVVAINRVAKVVKGGRRFSFTAVVVVGDGKGQVGVGLGRANEVPEAIRKGSTIARRNMIRVPMRNGTIPHVLTADFGAARVLLKPAAPGTGVIAGGGVRAILEAAGVRNVLTKSLGSNNVINVVQATMVGLSQMRDPREARLERLRLAGRLPAPPPAAPEQTPTAAATAGAAGEGAPPPAESAPPAPAAETAPAQQAVADTAPAQQAVADTGPAQQAVADTGPNSPA